MNELPDDILNAIAKNNYASCCGEKHLATNFCKNCAKLLKSQTFSQKSSIYYCGHCFKKYSNSDSFIPKICNSCAAKFNKCQNCCNTIICEVG